MVTRTTAPNTVRPGGTRTHPVRAKNISRLPYPNDESGDDLSDDLDDAKTSIGTVAYSEPKVSHQGAIPPGRTATGTYSVAVDDQVGGAGEAGGADPCTAVLTGSRVQGRPAPG